MFEVRVARKAKKKLAGIEIRYQDLIVSKLKDLATDPQPPGCTKVMNTVPQAWRIRSGKYRVLYSIDENERIVLIHDIDLRDRIYKKKS